jgi:NitT/TauT family transport system substrate-binding protein
MDHGAALRALARLTIHNIVLRRTRMKAFAVVAMLLSMICANAAQAQEKVQIGAALHLSPVFYLPVLAAKEKGFFQKEGLDVEWLPSQSGADMTRAFAASAIQFALSSAVTDTIAIARGVPLSIVAGLQPYDDFAIWSATKGKIVKPEDMKGAKIGVSRFGGLEHSYAQLAVKTLGLQNQVQYVSTGGVKESLAALITGAIDAVVLPLQSVLALQLDNRVRDVVDIQALLPKEWISYSIVANRDFIAKNPETARKVVQSIIAANRFIMTEEGKTWALAKMQAMNNYSPEGARIIYDRLSFSQDGKIPSAGIKNVLAFMSEYEILKQADVPSVEKLVDDQFVR